MALEWLHFTPDRQAPKVEPAEDAARDLAAATERWLIAESPQNARSGRLFLQREASPGQAHQRTWVAEDIRDNRIHAGAFHSLYPELPSAIATSQ